MYWLCTRCYITVAAAVAFAIWFACAYILTLANDIQLFDSLNLFLKLEFGSDFVFMFLYGTATRKKRICSVAFSNNLLVVNEQHIASCCYVCKCLCACGCFTCTTFPHNMLKRRKINNVSFVWTVKNNHIINFSINSKAHTYFYIHEACAYVRWCMHACMCLCACIYVSCLTNKTSKFLPRN